LLIFLVSDSQDSGKSFNDQKIKASSKKSVKIIDLKDKVRV